MKKITITLLFCLLLSSLTNAQVAINDNFKVCYDSNYFYPLENDYAYNNNTIVPSSLDLDPVLSGNQSSIIINSIKFTSNNGVIFCNFFPLDNYSLDLPYTFTDSSGSISNIGHVYLYKIRYNMQPDIFNNLSGTTTKSIFANDDPFINFNGDPVFLSPVYPGFTLQPDGRIVIGSSVPIGTYIMEYRVGNCWENRASVTVNVTELDLNVLGTYNDFNADGFVSLGDRINYEFNVINISSNTLNDVAVTSPVLNVVGNVIPTLAPATSNNSSYVGYHVLTPYDINNKYVYEKSVSVSGTSGSNTSTTQKYITTYIGNSDGIKLNAFFDTNNNNYQDFNERNINIGQFQVEVNNDGIIHNISSSSGEYFLYGTNSTFNYNLSYSVDANYSSYYSLTTSSYSNVNVTIGNGITTYNFPIVANTPFNDLSVFVIQHGAPPRPGFKYNNFVKFTNNSNQTISSGTVNFNCGTNVSILNTLPIATTLTSSNFSSQFTDLLPFETRYINVEMQVPTIPTVALGDLVSNSASILPNNGDITPLNNNNSITQVIVGSYDPNDMNESHGEKILHSSFTANDYLTYTIRFENTGTANAVNVNLNNVLNSQLNASTLKVIDASHNYVLDRVNNNLNFKFSGIDLPPSVENSQTGKGYLVYQIKPSAGYAVGDIIPNTANIYFDFNPAIVTNTFNTEFVSVLNADSFSSFKTIIYPNPVSNILNVESKEIISNIEVTDLNGRCLLSKKQNSNSTTLNLESLSNGIYFIKVSNQNETFLQKFFKN